MEPSDILALVKAGFTKDEIVQMAQPTPMQFDPEPVPVAVESPNAEPEQTPVASPVAPAVPTPVPVATPTQTPPQEQPQPTMADIMQGIARLTSAVQANAISHSSIPAGLQNPPSAEDMLAEIIRPTFKERT